MIEHGMYVADLDQAFLRIAGFVRRPDGLFERFAELHRNTAFTLADVLRLLTEAGWTVARRPSIRREPSPAEAVGQALLVARRGRQSFISCGLGEIGL